MRDAPPLSAFAVQVRKRGSRFVEEELQPDLPGLQDRYSLWEGLFRKGETRASELVELNGRIHRLPVHLSRPGSEVGYVAVDSSGQPISAPPGASISRDEEAGLRAWVGKCVVSTESIAPGFEKGLWSGFVRPNFAIPRVGAPEQALPWESLGRHPRVVLLGQPGAGKTTCLRRLALEIAQPKDEDRLGRDCQIPVYLPLRAVRSGDIMSEVRAAVADCGVPSFVHDIERHVAAGDAVLLLDGLDEVAPGIRPAVSRGIAALSNALPLARCVVSTRTANYDWALSDYTHLEVRPLTDGQIEEMACASWMGSRLGRVRERSAYVRFIHGLRESPALWEATRNPLLLCIAIILFSRSGLLPNEPATLIRSFVEALLEGWDRSRGVTRSLEPWTASHYRMRTLCALSFQALANGREVFTTNDFESVEPRPPVEPTAMLQRLFEDSGLIVRLSETQWAFSHRLFMEFLAAAFVVESVSDIAKFRERFKEQRDWCALIPPASGLAMQPVELLRVALKPEVRDSDAGPIVVATILGQPLTHEEGLVNVAVDYVVGALETALAEADVRSVAPVGAGHWEVSVTNCDVAPLAEQVVRARTGGNSNLLRNRLLNSPLDAIRLLAMFWDQAGWFGIRSIAMPNGRNLLRGRCEHLFVPE